MCIMIVLIYLRAMHRLFINTLVSSVNNSCVPSAPASRECICYDLESTVPLPRSSQLTETF